jgi:NAD+ diphosphatase
MPAAHRPNPFSGLALDRLDQWRGDRVWLQAAWRQGRLLRVDFEGRTAFAADGATLHAPPCVDVALDLPGQASFLGSADGVPWFALPATATASDDGLRWHGLREAAGLLSAFDSGLFAYAKALLLWQTRAAFCGACGSPTALVRAGHARRCQRHGCGLEQFPRTDAAVIVLVTDGAHALLGRQAGWPARRYSTLAGFVEPGESLEDALRREVLEEAGVRVDACHYQSSQPWPFPASLMLGFRAAAAPQPVVLGDELEDARWLSADAMLEAVSSGELLLSPPISISFRLIADWLLEQAGPQRVRALLPQA